MVKLNDFETIGDTTSRIEGLEKKEMITDEYLNEKFYSVYKMYSNYLLDYLDEKIGLKSYDEDLKNKNIFSVVDDLDKDIYQKFSKYNYFYIRNNLAIEKLDDYYIQELLLRYDEAYSDYDDFAKEMIEKTYVDVCNSTNVSLNIRYGPQNGNYFAPSNSIVLGCRPNNKLGETEDFYDFLQKEKIFYETIDKVNEEAKDKFLVPLTTFYYDTASTVSIEDFSFSSDKKKVK